MVATTPGLTAEQAVSDNYVMVDWGTSFAITHARHFPDMTTPRARVGLGRMAKALIEARGGAAYLAEAMVRDQLREMRLFRVDDAPVIERIAYGVYPVNCGHRQIIEKTLSYFSDPKSSFSLKKDS
jgi:DNA-binding transcriptional LysR family regulator